MFLLFFLFLLLYLFKRLHYRYGLVFVELLKLDHSLLNFVNLSILDYFKFQIPFVNNFDVIKIWIEWLK